MSNVSADRQKKAENKLFRECLREAEGFIMSYLTFNFPIAYTLRTATKRFGHVWTEMGLDINNPTVRKRFFNEYAQKRLWEWKRSKTKMRPYIEQRNIVAEEAGLWIHDALARLLRLQDILESNEGKDKGKGGDKVALEAIKVAGEIGQRSGELAPPPGMEDIKQLLAFAKSRRKHAKPETATGSA